MSIITNDLPEVKRLESELLRVRADNELQQKNITFKAKQLVEFRAQLAEAHELDIKQHAALVRDTLEIGELEAERDALRARLQVVAALPDKWRGYNINAGDVNLDIWVGQAYQRCANELAAASTRSPAGVPFPTTNPCAVCGVKDGHTKGCPEDTSEPAVPDAGGARETLAALAHEQWSGWMEYMFGRMGWNVIGTAMVMNSDDAKRWKRQMKTPYADLPESEKESDRAEADKVIAALAAQRAAPFPFAARLSEWADKTFPNSTVKSIRNHLYLEADELRVAQSDDAIREEAADVYMMLTHLANKQGFDLLQEAERKFEIVQGREWGEPDADGVVGHVRAAPLPDAVVV